MMKRWMTFSALGAALLLGAASCQAGAPKGGPEQVAPGTSRLKNVMVLGDSFAASPAFQKALRKELADSSVTFDAVGGSSLAEQKQRFAAHDPKSGHALIIMDGGLTDPDPREQVAGITSQLTDSCPLWVYVEPSRRAVANSVQGSPRFKAHAMHVATVRKAYPSHFIPTMDKLMALTPKDALDRADNAKGWVARSYRRDNLHLSDQGFAVLASIVAHGLREAARKPCGD